MRLVSFSIKLSCCLSRKERRELKNDPVEEPKIFPWIWGGQKHGYMCEMVIAETNSITFNEVYIDSGVSKPQVSFQIDHWSPIAPRLGHYKQATVSSDKNCVVLFFY